MGGQVACVGEMRNVTLWEENPNRRNHLEDLGVDGETISGLIFEKYGG